jgi:hypothetical protein
MNLIITSGGRKFFYGMIFETMVLVMLILGYIDGEQFIYATLIIYGTMAGTNAITTAIGLQKGSNGNNDATKSSERTE